MKTYRIPVYYEMKGYLEIEAESKEEAIDIAMSDECGLPDNATYIDGSFEVAEEAFEDPD